MNDPHDNSEHWAGNMPPSEPLSSCCSAPVVTEIIGHDKLEGAIYADHPTCEECGARCDA